MSFRKKTKSHSSVDKIRSQPIEQIQSEEISISLGLAPSSHIQKSSKFKKDLNSSLKPKKFLPRLLNPNSKNNVFRVFLFNILLPSFFFWGVCFVLIGVQILVHDICYRPEKCECRNFGVYIYTQAKYVLNVYSLLLTLMFYGAILITDDFYHKIYFKNVYIPICFIILTFFYGYDYDNRNKSIAPATSRRNSVIIILYHLLYILILTYDHKNFNKKFLRNFFLMTLFQVLLFGYAFYLKTYGFLFLMEYLRIYFDHDYALNIQKILLLIISFFYEFIMSKLIRIFYVSIKEEKNNISLNMIHYFMKLVYIDVYSLRILNILCSKLNDYAQWISCIIYFYFIFSTYSKSDFFKKIYKKGCNFFFKRKITPKKEKEQGFEEIKYSCIYQVNLIIFFRIITFKCMDYFIIFTKEMSLYEDCSLKEAKGEFEIYSYNVIIVFIVHSLANFLFLLIFSRKKNFSQNYQVEDLNFVSKLLIFVFFFQYSDHSLQIYKEIIEKF